MYEDHHGMFVQYLGGFQGHGRKRLSPWYLRFDDHAFVVIKQVSNGMFNPFNKYPVIRQEPYDRVRIFVEPSGQRSPNVAAIATFGVLGAGAGTNTTLVTVQYPDGKVFFLSKGPLHEWKAALANRLQRNPAMASSVHFGPPVVATRPPVVATRPPVDRDDPLSKLERLAALHKAGVLTDEEFAEKKNALLSQM